MAVIKVYSTHISQTGPTPTFKNIYHFYTTWLQLQHIAIFQHISGKSFGGIKTSMSFILFYLDIIFRYFRDENLFEFLGSERM